MIAIVVLLFVLASAGGVWVAFAAFSPMRCLCDRPSCRAARREVSR